MSVEAADLHPSLPPRLAPAGVRGAGGFRNTWKPSWRRLPYLQPQIGRRSPRALVGRQERNAAPGPPPGRRHRRRGARVCSANSSPGDSDGQHAPRDMPGRPDPAGRRDASGDIPPRARSHLPGDGTRSQQHRAVRAGNERGALCSSSSTASTADVSTASSTAPARNVRRYDCPMPCPAQEADRSAEFHAHGQEEDNGGPLPTAHLLEDPERRARTASTCAPQHCALTRRPLSTAVTRARRADPRREAGHP